MRQTLANWVSDSDALRHLEQFRVREVPLRLAYLRACADDYYIALVGELFERMRSDYGDANQWARLGNSFVQFASIRQEHELRAIGVELNEARLFGAAAFYLGGFPASAYLTLNEQSFATEDEVYLACFDLLARPPSFRSSTVQSLVEALLAGNLSAIASIEVQAAANAADALQVGPDTWIPQRLLHQLVARFVETNVRAVLPDGESNFWTPLVSSLLKQAPPVWDFFPSQIEAIRSGLLALRVNMSETLSCIEFTEQGEKGFSG